MNNVLASTVQTASVRLINRNWFELDEDTQAQTDSQTDRHHVLKRPCHVAMKDKALWGFLPLTGKGVVFLSWITE